MWLSASRSEEIETANYSRTLPTCFPLNPCAPWLTENLHHGVHREARGEPSVSLQLNHLVIVAIEMDRLIEIREQFQTVSAHKTHSGDFSLLQRLVRK